MSKIKYDLEIMGYMSVFEAVTRTRLKDAFIGEDGVVTFIVKEGSIAKAIGKKGVNVHTLEKRINRKIKIVEFNSHVLQFVTNLVQPLKVRDISQEGYEITITGPDTKTKGLLIGRSGKNLRAFENIVKRYFNDIKEIKVI